MPQSAHGVSASRPSRTQTIRCATAVILTALCNYAFAAGPQIANVVLSKPFFSPALHQSVTISFVAKNGGTLHAVVLDRDGFPVRTLAPGNLVKAGPQRLTWDGRDDHGEIVPDEAWSFKIDLVGDGFSETYFPAQEPSPSMLTIRADSYNRNGGILAYTLPAPSRVHIQAGLASPHAKTASTEGMVLKTIVDRAPRAGGAVIESWNGMDESGVVYVPDMPGFVVAIAATPLPANSVITTGNRTRTFLTSAALRTGTSLFAKPAGPHAHHQGLTALEDSSPPLKLEVEHAVWSAAKHEWSLADGPAKLTLAALGPAAPAFIAGNGKLYLFVDGHLASTRDADASTQHVEVPVATLPTGSHLITTNWVSPNGPVAVGSLRLQIGRVATERSAR